MPKQVLRILLIVLSGEGIFLLPFVLARIFRPTFLAAFQITNTELGWCFSVYGIVALVSYVFGGPLADAFAPRKLMTWGLVLTAIGGFFMAQLPSFPFLMILFACWGFTTIFLFWAAMIKATRVLGGDFSQGKTFGLVEGGRGLVAASIGGLGVAVFSYFSDVGTPDHAHSFQQVVYFCSFFVLLIALAVWLFFKEGTQVPHTETHRISWEEMRQVMAIPTVKWLMIIVLSAYVGYKLTDVFSLFAAEMLGFDEVAAAQIGAFQLFLRPVFCVFIGFAMDRSTASKWLLRSFVILGVGALMLVYTSFHTPGVFLFGMGLLLTAFGTYGLRTIYFAAMREGQVPLKYTGTAVGLISLVGYTPDIFVGPVIGYFLDTYPKGVGFGAVFSLLIVFSVLGGFASRQFRQQS